VVVSSRSQLHLLHSQLKWMMRYRSNVLDAEEKITVKGLAAEQVC